MKPFNRQGLHRLECPVCPCYGYFTVAMLENAGQLPTCFARGCGETMQPTRIELAILLGAEDAPVMHALEDLTERKLRAQFPAAVRASRRGTVPKNDMAARALDELRVAQRDQARRRRLSALLPTFEPLPF